MRKQCKGILITLICLTALLVFAPLLEQNLKLFTFKKLVGYKKPAPKPVLSYDAFVSGKFQQRSENYLKEHFGFREPLIRMYNQCTYDWFKTTSNNEIHIGRDGWLYHTESALQYYGNMESWFDMTNSQVRENLISKARDLSKVNAILQQYGVHLLTFTLPTKSYIYPEHLRWQPIGDTTFNATPFFEQQLDSHGVPHINMVPWFKQVQDTTRFDLFFNLAAPLKHEPIFEYPVRLLTNEQTVYPTVWFVGTSFYWYMTRRVNFDALFRDRDFLFYYAMFYTDSEQKSFPADRLDYLRELLLHDYVVFFRDGPQLYNDGMLFPGKALISLCISDERLKEKASAVADSLYCAWKATTHQDSVRCNNQAHILLQRHPELFEELRGESIPSCRNPRIGQILVEKEIRADRNWSFLLKAMAENDSLKVRELYKMESYNVMNHRPLLCDKAYFTTYDYFDFLVDEASVEIQRSLSAPATEAEIFQQVMDTLQTKIQQHAYDDDTLMIMACTMDATVVQLSTKGNLSEIEKKASNWHISIDKAFRKDALWCCQHNKNKMRNLSEATLVKALDSYQIERRLRRNKASMESIMQKHREMNLPLRIIINRDIEWIRQNRKQ